jgi:hypothetical protein
MNVVLKQASVFPKQNAWIISGFSFKLFESRPNNEHFLAVLNPHQGKLYEVA